MHQHTLTELGTYLNHFWRYRDDLVFADDRITGSKDHIRIGGVIDGWDVVRKDDGAWVISSSQATYVLPCAANGHLHEKLEQIFHEAEVQCNARLGPPLSTHPQALVPRD